MRPAGISLLREGDQIEGGEQQGIRGRQDVRVGPCRYLRHGFRHYVYDHQGHDKEGEHRDSFQKGVWLVGDVEPGCYRGALSLLPLFSVKGYHAEYEHEHGRKDEEHVDSSAHSFGLFEYCSITRKGVGLEVEYVVAGIVEKICHRRRIVMDTNGWKIIVHTLLIYLPLRETTGPGY